MGAPYTYPDLPRAGDAFLTPGDQALFRFIRERSKPDEPVLCTTWFLGGGREAFFAERRNPTSYDVPHEVITRGDQAILLEQLRKDPPALIVGDYFDLYGDEAKAFIHAEWGEIPGAPTHMFQRKTKAARVR